MEAFAATIAKLKFQQAIKTSETNTEARLPADVSAQLFTSIEAVLQQNTPANIQTCTDCIMEHIAPSKARIDALGDYLTALSKNTVVDQSTPVAKASRNRMDLLRIVSDVLHADKFHRHNNMQQGMFGNACGKFVAQLIQQVAEFMTEKDTQLEKDLVALINYWALNRLASPDCLKLFRQTAGDALLVAQGSKRNYLLPEYHGDKTAPWYDLPASYMLEPMIKLRDPKNDSIDPQDIRIQKLGKKPVSPHVQQLLDDFFDNIDLRYRPTADNPTGETTRYTLSLDPVGQLVKRDKETGQAKTVANGYGWSMKFCQDLRKYGVPENIKIAHAMREGILAAAPAAVAVAVAAAVVTDQRRPMTAVALVHHLVLARGTAITTHPTQCVEVRMTTVDNMEVEARRGPIIEMSLSAGRSGPNKRPSYVESIAIEPSDDESKLWEAECILEERFVRGVKKYHIKWKGTDPSTGKEWPTTWEPEENANDELVAHWQQEKAQRSEHSIRRRSEQKTEGQASRRIRNSRVIESSPESADRSSSTSASSTPIHSRSVSANISSTAASCAGIQTTSRRASPHIHIPQRGRSLERNEFEVVSQISSSQPISTQTLSQDTDLDSSQLFATTRPYSSGIVPDSQSFIPPTQHTGNTSQQSIGSSSLPEEEEEEDLANDSGLLEIVQGAALATSPTRSIPETIPDTTATDSQSQQRRARVSGVLELVRSLSQAATSQDRDQEQALPTIEDSEEAAVQLVIESETLTGGSHSVEQSVSSASVLQQPQERVSQIQALAEADESGSLEFVNIDEIPLSPRHPSTVLGNSPISRTDICDVDRSAPQIAAVDLGESAQPVLASQHLDIRVSQPSQADNSVADNDQFQFHSQFPIRDSQPEPQSLRPSSQPPAGASATLAAQNGQALTGLVAPNRAPSDLSYDSPHQSVTLPAHSQPRNNNCPEVLSISKSVRNSPPASGERRQSFDSLDEPEQHAQVVALEAVLSTQEETVDSIRSTVEKDCTEDRASPESRHDSSQETPEQLSRIISHSSSPVPHPPSYSLKTQESGLPSRPCTPASISSASNMASESTADIIKRQMEEALAKHRAENPFTPRKRTPRSSVTPSVPAAEGPTAPAAASRLSRAAEQEGTRSPSTVPDRSPAVQVPTSLRTVVYAPRAASPQDETMVSLSGVHPEPAEAEDAGSTAPEAHPHAGSDDMDVSDADDEDSESLLNDDLQLAEQEFIVPLFIQGRQSDMYTQHIALKKDILEQFLKDPHSVKPISQMEEILSYLRAIETHIDLVFAEAESCFLNDEMSMTQSAHAAQFGMDNSTKFRFLHKLFGDIRDSGAPKHVVVVTEKDDDALFQILDTFCKAKNINYNMPTRGIQPDPAKAEGNLLVTIIPNNAPDIIRPADLIICLDGFQEATQIRKQNWAVSPERQVIPVIHLVIPRTVGHIERYISPSLNAVERIHTILASLAHVRPDIGKAIDENTPRDTVCASLVAEWIMDTTEGAELSWPIPSIGSIKDVIEYQTQMSQPLANSRMPERIKRPLADEEELDPAKRMRFTPQPQTTQNSGMDQDNEVTRISDSMPGTTEHESNLQKRLAQFEDMYRVEREARKAEQRRFLEHEEMWDRQQTVHENLARDYRVLMGKQQAAEKRLETLQENNTTLTERLTSRTSEMRELEKQLKELRTTHLLSPDQQIIEITKLRKDLATMQQERDKAIKNSTATDNMLEYTRTAYQDAQKAAATANTRITELEAQVAKLTHAASGEAAKLKSMHIDRSFETQNKFIMSLKAELGIVKKALQNKEEEVTRLKSQGRQGVGTRGTSVTPQPKIRSRAGSPSLVGGRLANLRNG
ncbi:hypothetical protein yc1106_00270 [Curvularia clavata]|uniref:CID domain-containing protein n=1 Tax=Curvularia clavata TaxID=95742 RepID=A0A9Q9DP69_CURCL|nr:hypothetical protein yc1106_00270 [Curvularia clavata]